MSFTKTTKGYTIRWYDVGGRERQRTYKGITRDEARTLERGILAGTSAFEKDKAQMAMQLLDRNRQALFEDWVNTVMRDERIEYKRKAHPKQQESPAEDAEPVDQSAPAKS